MALGLRAAVRMGRLMRAGLAWTLSAGAAVAAEHTYWSLLVLVLLAATSIITAMALEGDFSGICAWLSTAREEAGSSEEETEDDPAPELATRTVADEWAQQLMGVQPPDQTNIGDVLARFAVPDGAAAQGPVSHTFAQQKALVPGGAPTTQPIGGGVGVVPGVAGVDLAASAPPGLGPPIRTVPVPGALAGSGLATAPAGDSGAYATSAPALQFLAGEGRWGGLGAIRRAAPEIWC